MPVTVTGTGTASGPADETVLDLQVQVRRGSASEALDALAAAVGVVFEVLDGGPAHQHATSDLSLAAERDREGLVRGHQASQLVTTVVAVGDAGRVVADVVTAGGDAVSVRSLSQRAGDRGGLRRRARELAVADARAAAHQHAELAERRLGRLTEVVEGGGPGAPRPLATRTMAMAEAVPVATGSDEVTVTVTATWDLD